MNTQIILNKYKTPLLLALCIIMYALTAKAQPKITDGIKTGNPIITDTYTAALVYHDTVFLYVGHDEAPPKRHGYVLNEWLIYYSTDMVHWTEHPEPLSTKAFTWAKGDAWASQVVEKDDTFYWYVTVSHDSIHGKSIGVAVADRPTGPFKDARGSAIITNDMTTEGVDPAK